MCQTEQVRVLKCFFFEKHRTTLKQQQTTTAGGDGIEVNENCLIRWQEHTTRKTAK